MTQEGIFEIIVASSREVVPHLEHHTFQPEDGLRDLGANSIDYWEIVALTLETLSLGIPLVSLVGVENVGDLARTLHERMAAS